MFKKKKKNTIKNNQLQINLSKEDSLMISSNNNYLDHKKNKLKNKSKTKEEFNKDNLIEISSSQAVEILKGHYLKECIARSKEKTTLNRPAPLNFLINYSSTQENKSKKNEIHRSKSLEFEALSIRSIRSNSSLSITPIATPITSNSLRVSTPKESNFAQFITPLATLGRSNSSLLTTPLSTPLSNRSYNEDGSWQYDPWNSSLQSESITMFHCASSQFIDCMEDETHATKINQRKVISPKFRSLNI